MRLAVWAGDDRRAARHLELAAAFQAITYDSFSPNPKHPIRRLLDPFIHRSVQATNDNFKLLFEYRAAEFSLAPLGYMEQLELLQKSIEKFPVSLAKMDMKHYPKYGGNSHGCMRSEAEHKLVHPPPATRTAEPE